MQNKQPLLDRSLAESDHPPQPKAKGQIGRPRKADALSDADRARRYRARKKARLAELKDDSKPLCSAIIDLSALPPWKRR